MGKARKKRGELRLKELISLGAEHGIEVHCFSPIHMRATGRQVVDYWPTTGRVWVLGTGKAMDGEPADVIRLANLAVVDHEQAESHMRSIMDDDGPPPW